MQQPQLDLFAQPPRSPAPRPWTPPITAIRPEPENPPNPQGGEKIEAVLRAFEAGTLETTADLLKIIEADEAGVFPLPLDEKPKEAPAEPEAKPLPEIKRWTAACHAFKEPDKLIRELRAEARSFTELHGEIGGEEYTSGLYSPFGPVYNPQAIEIHARIGNRWGWTITASNRACVMAEIKAGIEEARKTRTVIDKRRTPEEADEQKKAAAIRDEERKAAQDAKDQEAETERQARRARYDAEAAHRQAQLEAKPSPPATGSITPQGDAPIIRRNVARAGLEIKFRTKPFPAVISWLKANGFRWNRAAGLWYTKHSDEKEARTRAHFGQAAPERDAKTLETPKPQEAAPAPRHEAQPEETPEPTTETPNARGMDSQPDEDADIWATSSEAEEAGNY